jgi:hypothetical protein
MKKKKEEKEEEDPSPYPRERMNEIFFLNFNFHHPKD